MVETVKLDDAVYAVIMQSSSIREDYKEMAKRYKGNAAVLREILLCAFDAVDPLLMQSAEEKKPLENALAYIRKKHWEKKLFGRYHEEIESIMHTVNSIESGVRAVSGQISVIEDKVPTMEDLFTNITPQIPEESVVIEKYINEQPMPVKGSAVPQGLDSPETGRNSLIKDIGIVMSRHRAYRKAAAESKKSKNHKAKEQKQKEPLSKWFSALQKRGYSPEQLQFILSCVEEDMEREVIERFIAPNLSVEIMQNLKRLELQKLQKEEK